MKVLSTNQSLLRFFFVFSDDEPINKCEKLCYAITTLAILLAHICAVAAGMGFFLKFISVDLVKAFYSLFNIFGDVSVLYISIFLLLQRKKIVGIFKKMSQIYDESKLFSKVKLIIQNSDIF